MTYDREKVFNYADSFYNTPCHDDIIASTKGTISVPHEFSKRLKGEKRADWQARFEWNFVDPKTGTKHLEAGIFVNLRSPSQKVLFAPWDGMNDCAHFVSRCIEDGGLTGVYDASVPRLEEKLRKHGQTKTFGDKINYDRAKRIIDSGLLKKGDVVIYYEKKHKDPGHSAVYMGDGTITCHTRSRNQWNWRLTKDDDRYCLVHFAHDDSPPDARLKSALIGWWEVKWKSDVYYYHYSSNGTVAYTKIKPTNTKKAISSPKQRGYWFGKNSKQHEIIWSRTGTVERFKLDGSNSQKGDWNDSKNVVSATKL